MERDTGSEPAEPGQVDPAGLAVGALGERMGLRMTHASAVRVEGWLPVEGNTQPYGLLHGGASVVLAESLGSTGAALHAGPGRIAVGVDINTTHHRSARHGRIHGVATAVHRGRSLASYEVVITDDAGLRVATARITCMLRDAPQPGHVQPGQTRRAD
ncbi:MAG: PaaI family thioesterase [Actinomycetes bacterium]